MATIDVSAVTKSANVRPEGDDAPQYERPITKLGSRVTKKQTALVLAVLTPTQQKALLTEVTALHQYADTGDASALSAESAETIKKVVSQAREKAESESQARRVWPRKVAAIIAQLAA